MLHQFCVEVAEKYGVNCALLLHHINYWIEHNKKAKKHYHDGLYWTYGSVKKLSEYFPYLTEKQVRTALNMLEKEGVIKTGNYNKGAFDRTKWYTITKTGDSILHKGQMEITNKENGTDYEVKAIPDNNTKYEKDRKKGTVGKKPEIESYNQILQKVKDEDLKHTFLEFIKMRKLIKKPLTNKGLECIISRVENLSSGCNDLAIKILQQSIRNSYPDVYELKKDKASPKGSNITSVPFNPTDLVRDENGELIVF